MSENENPELEQLLRAAFDARASSAVGDAASPPPARFLIDGAAADATPVVLGAPRHQRAPRRRHTLRWAAPLAAAAAVVGIIGGVMAVGNSSNGEHHHPAAADSIVGPAGTRTVSRPAASPSAATNTVHVKLLNDDDSTYGVGMPVIAYFSRNIADGKALQQATVATVNGKRVKGAWNFEKSAAGFGPIEAHYRMRNYWPAHANIRVSIPVKGMSAGGRLHYDDSLTSDFKTGDKNIVTVANHRIIVRSDGTNVADYPCAIGPSTRPGTKVIMEQQSSVMLKVKGQYKEKVQYAQRLTYGGEYLLAAPWNESAIQNGIDSSNGSTNLMPAAAQSLFDRLRIGDVVKYPGADGTPMAMSSGYGDWSMPWSTWLKGGLVRIS